jgi:GH24 family phage-related lysozyme (muramidase)
VTEDALALIRRSDVLASVNAGRLHEVPAQLKHWNRAGGRVVRGLSLRRAAEARLFAS